MTDTNHPGKLNPLGHESAGSGKSCKDRERWVAFSPICKVQRGSNWREALVQVQVEVLVVVRELGDREVRRGIMQGGRCGGRDDR
jgi:hypothetical protein